MNAKDNFMKLWIKTLKVDSIDLSTTSSLEIDEDSISFINILDVDIYFMKNSK